MLEEDSETLRIAAAEAWHPGIMKKVEGYGRYCVRQFGPDGNACLVDEVDPVHLKEATGESRGF